ncbi:MAG: PEP-CTERM sorting domain-containing protein [Isosphaerales bacterium]
MRSRSLTSLLFALFLLHSPSPVLASKILLIAGADENNDLAIQAVLQSQGNSVTIGPTFSNFTGAGLAGYNAVLLMPNGNYWAQPDMPASGQQALLNFVNNGGGLVAGEPVLSMNAYPGDFKTLAQGLPAWYAGAGTANSPITFGTLTSDPVINAHLPASFSFTATGYYTESYILPRTNATAFFSTNQWTSVVGSSFAGNFGAGAGAAGWNYGAGRVLSLSTFSDNVELGDPNYDRLLANAVNWATQSSGWSPPPVPAPEPSSIAVFLAAALGFFAIARKRR